MGAPLCTGSGFHPKEGDTSLGKQIASVSRAIWGFFGSTARGGSVLVGCDSREHFECFKKTGLYNLRAGSRQGSVRLEPTVADARHLMLHTRGGKALSGLWRIKKRGPRIFTAEELLWRGYPSQPDPDAIYAVFDVEPDPYHKDRSGTIRL